MSLQCIKFLTGHKAVEKGNSTIVQSLVTHVFADTGGKIFKETHSDLV